MTTGSNSPKVGDHVRSPKTTYRLVAQLGAGGMSEVFLAVDLTTDTQVALKFVRSPKHLKRAELEAKILMSLRHELIVLVLDVFSWLPDGGDQVSLVMAQTLERGERFVHLMEQGELSLIRALDIVQQVLCALAYAHTMGVVHRDLKPENLALNEREDGGDRIKLLDFGIAKLLDSASTLTATQDLVGTLAYMAPEQIIKDHPIDARTDIYAVGILIYELFTGRRPFQSDYPQGVLSMHLTLEPPALSRTVPEEMHGPWLDKLQAVVSRALAKHPGQRFTCTNEMIEALDEVIDALLGDADPNMARRRAPARDPERCTSFSSTDAG